MALRLRGNFILALRIEDRTLICPLVSCMRNEVVDVSGISRITTAGNPFVNKFVLMATSQSAVHVRPWTADQLCIR